jgi:hypothetical protein
VYRRGDTLKNTPNCDFMFERKKYIRFDTLDKLIKMGIIHDYTYKYVGQDTALMRMGKNKTVVFRIIPIYKFTIKSYGGNVEEITCRQLWKNYKIIEVSINGERIR